MLDRHEGVARALCIVGILAARFFPAVNKEALLQLVIGLVRTVLRDRDAQTEFIGCWSAQNARTDQPGSQVGPEPVDLGFIRVSRIA